MSIFMHLAIAGPLCIYTFFSCFKDGCDFVCRRIGRSRQSREYRGIGEEQVIPDYESDTNRDDSLLPM